MSAPSVLHLACPARHGGLERAVSELAIGQTVGGQATAVALVLECGHGLEHPLLETLASHCVPTHVLRLRKRAYLAERRGVARLLRSLSPAVLHTHGFRPDVVDADLARRMGIASVTTAHGFVGLTRRVRFYETVQRFVAKWSDAVVGVSPEIVSQFLAAGVSPSKVYLIPNAIGEVSTLTRTVARRKLGLQADGPLVGWIGRLSYEKGPDLFVRAVARMPADTQGVIIGEGPERAGVESLMRDLGLQGRVSLTGALPSASQYLSAFDALLLTSRTEGTPMVVLEAMSVGTPVVATSVGGVPPLLEHGAGLLVPMGSAERLAAACSELLASDTLHRKISDTARKRIKDRHALPDWVQCYADVYSAAVRQRLR